MFLKYLCSYFIKVLIVKAWLFLKCFWKTIKKNMGCNISGLFENRRNSGTTNKDSPKNDIRSLGIMDYQTSERGTEYLNALRPSRKKSVDFPQAQKKKKHEKNCPPHNDNIGAINSSSIVINNENISESEEKLWSSPVRHSDPPKNLPRKQMNKHGTSLFSKPVNNPTHNYENGYSKHKSLLNNNNNNESVTHGNVNQIMYPHINIANAIHPKTIYNDKNTSENESKVLVQHFYRENQRKPMNESAASASQHVENLNHETSSTENNNKHVFHERAKKVMDDQLNNADDNYKGTNAARAIDQKYLLDASNKNSQELRNALQQSIKKIDMDCPSIPEILTEDYKRNEEIYPKDYSRTQFHGIKNEISQNALHHWPKYTTAKYSARLEDTQLERNMSNRSKEHDKEDKESDFMIQIKTVCSKIKQYENELKLYVKAPCAQKYHYIEENLMRLMLELDKLDIDHSINLRLQRKQVIRYIDAILEKLDQATY